MASTAAAARGAVSTAPYRLYTIAASHYCEKARWALDLGGVSYQEDKAPPVLHMMMLRRAGITSSHSVPALITPNGTQLTDSRDIVEYVAAHYPRAAHLYPTDPAQRAEVVELERAFSSKLGVLTRVVCYHYLFQQPNSLLISIISDVPGTPGWRQFTFRVLCPLIKAVMKQGMRINPENSTKCLERVRAIFAEVSERLSDGRPFLVAGTTAPTAADITFASLAAVLLPVPEHYGGNAGVRLPRPEELAPDFPAAELAATPAGQFVLRMYREHRMQTAAAGESGTRVSGQGSVEEGRGGPEGPSGEGPVAKL